MGKACREVGSMLTRPLALVGIKALELYSSMKCKIADEVRSSSASCSLPCIAWCCAVVCPLNICGHGISTVAPAASLPELSNTHVKLTLMTAATQRRHVRSSVRLEVFQQAVGWLQGWDGLRTIFVCSTMLFLCYQFANFSADPHRTKRIHADLQKLNRQLEAAQKKVRPHATLCLTNFLRCQLLRF
jgi:hypothetical protein